MAVKMKDKDGNKLRCELRDVAKYEAQGYCLEETEDAPAVDPVFDPATIDGGGCDDPKKSAPEGGADAPSAEAG